MVINYEDNSITIAINDFYKNRDINKIKKLMVKLDLKGDNVLKTFKFLLNETRDFHTLHLNRKPKAEHAIWVAQWLNYFLNKNKIKEEIYLCTALWHDLIEDNLKNESIVINSETI